MVFILPCLEEEKKMTEGRTLMFKRKEREKNFREVESVQMVQTGNTVAVKINSLPEMGK